MISVHEENRLRNAFISRLDYVFSPFTMDVRDVSDCHCHRKSVWPRLHGYQGHCLRSGSAHLTRRWGGTILYARRNLGNLCSPLLDSSGRLNGANTAIFSTSGTSSGVEFAIPSDTLTAIVMIIIESSSLVQRAHLHGLRPDQSSGRFQRHCGGGRGAWLRSIAGRTTGTEAARNFIAGAAWRCYRCHGRDGTPINTEADYLTALDGRRMGDSVSLTILHRPFNNNGTQPEAKPVEILQFKAAWSSKARGNERHCGIMNCHYLCIVCLSHVLGILPESTF